MNTNRKIARTAGILYIVTIVCGMFAEMIVRAELIVPGDATATANKIMASESLFRLGFVSDLIMMVAYLLLAYTLYVLLKPVGKHIAPLIVLFTSVGVAIMCLNMLNQFGALLLLGGADYLSVYDANQINAQAMLFINLQKHGYLIAQIFFGLWLLPLGYLVYKSGFFPKILGVLLMLAFLAYMVDFLVVFLLPLQAEAVASVAYVPIMLAEFSFCAWLLLMGAKEQQPQLRPSYAS
jgi:hypothetical protein